MVVSSVSLSSNKKKCDKAYIRSCIIYANQRQVLHRPSVAFTLVNPFNFLSPFPFHFSFFLHLSKLMANTGQTEQMKARDYSYFGVFFITVNDA